MSDEPVVFQASDPPPAIDGPDSLPTYEAWLSMIELQLGAAVNQGYFTDFPEAVLDRNSGASAFTGSLGAGAQGTAMLDLTDHVEALHSSWSSLAGAVRDLRSSVKGVRLELASLDNEQKKRKLGEHAERLRLTQEIVVSSIRAAAASAKACFPGSPGTGIAAVEETGIAATNITFAALQLGVLDDQAALGDDGQKINEDRLAFSFSQEATHTFDTLDQAVIGIRTASNQILASLNLVENNRQKAAWQLAKVSGADFAEIDGVAVAQNVNTVLNRQYNVLRIRYDKALESAKRAAYLARLSIEQRIGVRLNDLRQPIGPIDSPANWVDDLCSVQGIDYEKLRLADPDSPTFDDDTSATIQSFANQYVGDYVTKLQEFMEFYNIEFPFRQADDQAVLSLREDLLRPDAQCSVQSPNELYQSDRLFTAGQTGEGFESRQGWQATGCVDDGCLYVKDGSTLRDANGEPLLPPNGVGGISWLKVTDTPPFADPDEGPLGVATGNPLPDSPAPFGTVYQTVPLRAGRFYVLSWWDMARAMDGGPLSGPPQAYFVGIYDKDWRLVALSSPSASDGGADGNSWSARRELSVTAFDDGDYHIAFSPSELGERPASLAIGNVQLEEPDKNLVSASTYFRTEASRTIVNTECKQVTSEQLRKSFTRRCDGGRADGKAETCYYELDRDIVLDTEQLDAGFGGLVGRVGRDNYNTRHVDLALNLVGTGVLDCSGTGSAACYGAGFVEYDLQHIAFNAPIIDYDRATHCFNFAEGCVFRST